MSKTFPISICFCCLAEKRTRIAFAKVPEKPQQTDQSPAQRAITNASCGSSPPGAKPASRPARTWPDWSRKSSIGRFDSYANFALHPTVAC